MTHAQNGGWRIASFEPLIYPEAQSDRASVRMDTTIMDWIYADHKR